MRRSSLALLLVIVILALFVFINMRSLFIGLEKAELEAVAVRAEVQAELHVLSRRSRLPDPRSTFFDRITPLAGRSESGRRLVAAGRQQRLEIRRPLDDRSGLLFEKTLGSPQLDTLRGLRKILTLLVALLALLAAGSGITLMLRLGRRVPERKLDAGSPLQEYLVEMKNAQVELQQAIDSQRRASSKQEELNRSIVNNVHLGVIYVSGDGRVEIFNPAAQELFGRSLAAVKNVPLADALPGHPELARFIAAAQGKASSEIESGGAIWEVDVVASRAGDGGAPAARLALVRDVSEEKRRERIRRQNENLAMLGQMTASLAHEARNSLGVILGYGKGLKGDPEKTAKILGEVRFMSEMMESFLRFAQPVNPAARQRLGLGPLIAAAAAAQELAVDLPAAPLELQSDPLLLNVVFANLALNARQAGARRLRVEFVAGDAPEVCVADDGPGIPADNAQKIWLPFFSSRDKGTGMGLATVKKLLSALGADIQLLNPGKPGARFKITFYT